MTTNRKSDMGCSKGSGGRSVHFDSVVPQFAVQDVGQTAELRALGAEILDGPTDREYGQRKLVIRDANGLVLAFGQSIH